MAPTTTAPSSDARAVYILMSVVFVNIAGFGIVIPLLPFYGESFHASAWQVAMLFSAYSLGSFFAEPFWGRMSDRIGRRPVLMLTIAGNAAAYIALAFAPNLWVALACRVMGGALSGNISTIQGYVADVTPPEQRSGRLGLLGAAFGLGFITGPSLGGLLAHPGEGTIGFRPPLFTAAALCIVAALGVFLFVKESRKPVAKDAPRPGRWDAINEAVASPVISCTLLASSLAVGAFAGVEAIFGLWTQKRFGWGPREIGLCFAGIGVVGALLQGLAAGPLARRFGEGRVLVAGLSLILVALFFQSLNLPWPLAIVAMMIVATGQSLSFPAVAAMISRAASPSRQGEMLGLNLSGGALARITGPMAAGAAFTILGPSAPFLAGAILMAPALLAARSASRALGKSKS